MVSAQSEVFLLLEQAHSFSFLKEKYFRSGDFRVPQYFPRLGEASLYNHIVLSGNTNSPPAIAIFHFLPFQLSLGSSP